MGPILASFTLGLDIYERGLPLLLSLNMVERCRDVDGLRLEIDGSQVQMGW